MFLCSTVMASTGCLVGHDRRGGPVVVAPAPARGCPPSQYWDGHGCRQNGGGHDHDRHENRDHDERGDHDHDHGGHGHGDYDKHGDHDKHEDHGKHGDHDHDER
jgi:hypothetical protein